MELTKTSRTTAHKDIVKIAKLVKLEFKILVGENAKFNVPKYYQRLLNSILTKFLNGTTWFEGLANHILEQDAMNNHRNMLIKLVVELCLNVKLTEYSKSVIEFKPTVWKNLTKLILFQGN
uniref:(northern house mosquito) hypothetical protein n=1 Tax=Culex pipiens TaxID=7175 RepID=A0A8D8NFS1_CULPI